MKNRTILMLLFSLSMALSPAAIAQETTEPKRQSLSFEDELVEGGAQKPELFYLLQKRNFNYKKLIKLRKNFLPEMQKSSEVIQPGRSR